MSNPTPRALTTMERKTKIDALDAAFITFIRAAFRDDPHTMLQGLTQIEETVAGIRKLLNSTRA